jgi:hypothetical protein
VPEPDPVELPAVFRIHPIAYFAAFMMAVTSLALAGASLPYLGWTLAIPVLVALWIHRLRTIVTEEGVTAVSLRGRRSATWDQINGLQFPRWGAVRAVLNESSDGKKSKLALPAISFRDLPRLSDASRGRIPDPYAVDSPEQERIDEDSESDVTPVADSPHENGAVTDSVAPDAAAPEGNGDDTGPNDQKSS